MYKLIKKQKQARRGELITRKGGVQTPCFMPVATKGALKTLSIEEVKKLNPSVVLGNTYHLMLRPGSQAIKKMGGLSDFMNWPGPILTDSGGFQVFSLSGIRKISQKGVRFNSHLDGQEFFLSPEESIKIQNNIGSDIMMVLDECVELPVERKYLTESIKLTSDWASKCRDYFDKKIASKDKKKNPLLFGIVQGGLEFDLRKKSAEDLINIGFDGYAVGGLSVGESEQDMYSVLEQVCPLLPEDKPRYLMGVGYPHQIVEAVKCGIDMFDCVIPAREARHGRLYQFSDSRAWKDEINLLEKEKFYTTVNAKVKKFEFNLEPIRKESQFAELREYSKAYLRHLFKVEDPLAQRLATLNNLEFYLQMMKLLRQAIEKK